MDKEKTDKKVERIFFTFTEAQEFLGVSHQTIYNWICKWGLEKFRGKGRKIGGNLGKKKMAKRQTSPFHQQQQRIRAQRKGRKRPGT